ncbi:UDP-N-acetylglucosamine 2-epimerase [Methanosarcina sp. WWM596]|uniref:UDP-N-acetylglucosamine 2-epimerase n=1 Tax=Methanosarcina sp. WWM596 TaxID=1434103 RepID=UPI0006157998|nr:UDP-N-acetylglucosamine 2-epimerase [Methanosarcina sp. WWM596]AKB18819.1 hypothetical protein MSWHS_1956 [Methanosarcina sp. WWM596]
MSVNNDMFSENRLHKIFSYNKIQHLLSKNIGMYPLVYYFMRLFVSYISLDLDPLDISKSINSRSINSKSIIRNFIQKKNIFKFLLNNSAAHDNLDILFYSRSRFVPIKTFEGKETIVDYLFGSLFNHIKEYQSQRKVLFFVDNFFKSVPKNCEMPVHTFYEYSDVCTLTKSLIFSFFVYFEWIINKNKIIKHLRLDGCEFLIPLFTRFFSFQSLFSFIFYDYCFQNAIVKNKPKILIANDDVLSLKPKHLLNTKFFVMQSASLTLQKEQLVKMFITSFSLDDYLVDYFLVTGDKFKEMKQIAGDYKKIKVVGQPRYDSLYYLNKLESKDLFFEKYDINPKNKIILWTTQCSAMDKEENTRNFDSVFSAIKDLSNVTLIIKQHPGETNYHRELINLYLIKHNLNAIVPPKDSDTFELLNFCDLMISKDSTTVLEAVILNKPVIVLNLGKSADKRDYVKENIAIGVYDENSLKPSIEKLLFEDDFLAINRKLFINRYIYRFDGMSTKRVIELIDNEINNI